ncbi:MAG: HlyC/CorC family transporter [Alphaproteobacteria bacterium]|nr:HlyC/CorC family transporter [Alphaproteobacteria bacterium]
MSPQAWSLAIDVAVVLLLIVCNGFFAMAEIAVVSSRKVRLAGLAKDDPGAASALALHEHPGRFLSTVQIGITLIGVFTGAFSGATIAERLAVWLADAPYIGGYAEATALAIVVLAITFLSLIVGELAPKRIALAHAEAIASRVAGPLAVLARATSPVVGLLDGATTLLLRLFGIKRGAAEPATDEEIARLVEEGAEAGTFEAAEHDMVKRVFRFGDREVGSIMTPRTEIVWIDLADPPEENKRKIAAIPYSRFPVIEGDQANLLGIARIKDLAAQSLAGRSFDPRAVLRPAVFVPENGKAVGLIEVLRQQRVHMALVVDEYGVIQGLVTLTDIIESLVGDIPAADQPDDRKATRRADGSWLIDGLVPVDELRDILGVDGFEESEEGYRTLAGFVLARMGKVPGPTDAFEWRGHRFEVMDMDGRRIDKVLVVPPKPEEGAAS